MIESSPEFGCDEVSVEEAQAAVTDLLADKRFRLTDRGKSILRYLAEFYSPNQEKGVKAYIIAIDVLRRPETFDPALDPIVRIEVRRLRTALMQFYEVHGDENPIEIRVPVGKYRLAFNRRKPIDRDFEVRRDIEIPVRSADSPRSLIRQHSRLLALLGGGLASLMVATTHYFFRLGRRDGQTDRCY